MDRVEIAVDNLAISRIEEKCLHCGICLKTCEENNNIGSDCINCGQCILTCPGGAIVPKFTYRTVLNYLNDTNKEVIVVTSPAVRVAIGDEFGYEAGSFLEGKMIGVLRSLGFKKVFDTTYGADLTIMEEAQELVERLEKVEKLPLFTSCCPSWVNYAKKHQEEIYPNLSSCKSPIGMIGAMVKTYYAEYNNLNPEDIILVALTPCVSKKEEIYYNPDIDFCITTRELGMMIRETNIDFRNTSESEFDPLIGTGSGAGLIFGSSGGVTEAVLRTAYYLLNKEKAPEAFYNLKAVRGEKDFKETIVDLKKYQLKVAVINRIKTFQEKSNILKNYDFVEVMTCPGGCIGGAGQPLLSQNSFKEYREKREAALYQHDKEKDIQSSHENPDIKVAYETFIHKGKVKLHNKEKIKA